MWKVYTEVARERLGVMGGEADVQYFHRKDEARAAFSIALRSLEKAGYQPSEEVYPTDTTGVVEWMGFVGENSAAIVLLMEEEGDL